MRAGSPAELCGLKEGSELLEVRVSLCRTQVTFELCVDVHALQRGGGLQLMLLCVLFGHMHVTVLWDSLWEQPN